MLKNVIKVIKLFQMYLLLESLIKYIFNVDFSYTKTNW